ncbi:hypothetical protein BY458DRAFT_444982 [Sporodiniella umbellata]|nr:hypothetical protein BY458DRAFT_444982 [Sporodiniella umbellata]
MPIGQRTPSITPRPTKASMLRAQKQTGSSEGLKTPTSKPQKQEALVEEPKASPKPAGRTPSKATKTAKPSEGVRAFMAQQRARAANQTKEKDEKPAVRTKVMTGAQRYGTTTEEVVAPKSLQVLIKQAKGSGKLDISSRELKSIPEEVLKM